jgi:hypothetical protein
MFSSATPPYSTMDVENASYSTCSSVQNTSFADFPMTPALETDPSIANTAQDCAFDNRMPSMPQQQFGYYASPDALLYQQSFQTYLREFTPVSQNSEVASGDLDAGFDG